MRNVFYGECIIFDTVSDLVCLSNYVVAFYKYLEILFVSCDAFDVVR